MLLSNDTDALIKRHNKNLLSQLGLQSLSDIQPEYMAADERSATAKLIESAARSMVGKITDGTPEKRGAELEQAFDGLLSVADELRAPVAASEYHHKRPILADKVCHPDDEGDSHTRAFTDWLRSPHSESRKMELATVEKRLSSGLSGAAGGYAVPEQLVTPILSRARDENPFRQLSRVIQVGTSDVKLPLSQADATSGWVGEGDTRSATTEPTLALRQPTFGTGYANVTVTEELLEDAVMDVADWFADEAGRAMGEAEMAAIISGDGADKPTGLLNTAPESGADGSRTDLALKYLPTGSAATLGSTPADLLISTVYDLKASYRRNATWVMNSTIAGTVRKLKNGSGDYLWTDGLRQGQPATLLGFPVAIAESMDDEGTNTLPIMFGDFMRGYVLCDRVGLTVLPDPYTTKGKISFYIRNRIGGITYDENAIRVLKCAAS